MNNVDILSHLLYYLNIAKTVLNPLFIQNKIKDYAISLLRAHSLFLAQVLPKGNLFKRYVKPHSGVLLF